MTGSGGLVRPTAPVRAFVALPCPGGLARSIAEGLEKWRDLAPGIAWADPRTIHFTLRFLGDAGPVELERLDARLREVARAAGPVEARAGATGAFPSWGGPRVLWLGLESGGAVERLAEAVETEARGAGFDAEERRFTPHLTLARVRNRHGIRGAVAAVRGWEADPRPRRIDEMVLYRSRLGPGGARHDPLATYRLGGADR